ncbi:hypothetical protein L484_019214 [Morus notabilis]|uniref:Uncharacterized protein n=1 Tax=Morus notabilis TaxID=981085 RepID=W9QQZ2_9ROSA|nr:hypothetical protein L484_019214 [Morus notabilis]
MDVLDLCVRNMRRQERISGQALQRSSPNAAHHSLSSANEHAPLVNVVGHILSHAFQCYI